MDGLLQGFFLVFYHVEGPVERHVHSPCCLFQPDQVGHIQFSVRRQDPDDHTVCPQIPEPGNLFFHLGNLLPGV